MNLKQLLQLSSNREYQKQGISEERLMANMASLRKLISFFRQYPDIFVDFIKGKDSTFQFLFYQRIFLRIVMRHRYVYATFPRAYSKSFLSMMALMIRCILYPNSHLFVTTGGKEQAASITIAKIQQICKLIPGLNNEINWQRGVSTKSKDNVKYVFKNGSTIDILAARQSSRGQRRTGGLMQECVLIDGDILNEVIIPTTNVDRRLSDGSRHKEQNVNKSQIYITTAGWKNSFAYQKLIEILINSILDPKEYMIMGGTYETPVISGLLDDNFVEQLRLQGTFNDESFNRQYRSIWSGDVENAFFSSEKFDKYRVLLQPEYEYSGRSSKSAYYVFGIDVGRVGCTTEICVFKVTPQVQGAAHKTLVNIYTFDAQHFETQSIYIKKLYYKYRPKRIAIDANGLGVGLVDYLIKSQQTDEGEYLPPFGVFNTDEYPEYKKFITSETQKDLLYLIKANAPINTQAYSYAQTQMYSGKIRFLIDESLAKTKLMSTKHGQNMSVEERNNYLRPFILTSILKQQMLNLVQENEGVNIILKQSNRRIKKDKFSAFVYGLYYIRYQEQLNKKRRSRNISDFLFFTQN